MGLGFAVWRAVCVCAFPCTHAASPEGTAGWPRMGMAQLDHGCSSPAHIPVPALLSQPSILQQVPAATWRTAALSCRVNKLARETILLQLVGETLFR